MRLTSLSDYAVVMLVAAARAPTCARLSATALAGETGIPLPTAQKLTGKLAAAGLLATARGAGGGFRLARAPAAISLADIVEAVEGPIALATCVDATRHDCALEGACVVRPHMGVVNDVVRGALASVTLEQLSVTPALRLADRLAAQDELPSGQAGAQTSSAASWAPAFAGVEAKQI